MEVVIEQRSNDLSRIVVSEFLTVDGVMTGEEEWVFAFWSDEEMKVKHDELFASDALLLGRVTYEIFASSWPNMTDPDGFAERMNSIPKYVVSATLNEVSWNNSHLIKENIPEAVAKLKEQPGQDILVAGSAELVNSLMEHDLVDEYRLMISPVVVGTGKRLFKDGIDRKVLEHAGTRSLPHGVTQLTYRPATKAPEGQQPDWVVLADTSTS
jgi:dihydrofolate reductase